MDILAWLVFAAVMLAMVYTAVALIRGIQQNMAKGDVPRQRLAERVASLRFGRLLGRTGVGADEFLHSEPVHEIETQLRSCESCAAEKKCDEKLAAEAQVDEFDFCPNQGAMKALRDKKAAG